MGQVSRRPTRRIGQVLRAGSPGRMSKSGPAMRIHRTDLQGRPEPWSNRQSFNPSRLPEPGSIAHRLCRPFPHAVNIVLVEPEIPPNTGNIARLCAATGATLHLIEPLGFEIDDRRLARAGMDYWKLVQWRRWTDWMAFQSHLKPADRLWFVEQGAPRRYTDASFSPGDYLVFGRETAGLPEALLQAHRERWLDIPMANPEARSLNLSNCVAIVLFEALRQVSVRP